MKNRSQFVLARIAMLLLTVFMSLTAWAENITAEQALQQAQSFLKSHKAANGRRNAPAVAPQMKLAGQVSGLYVFNATDGGFVIVSNDDRTVPVLGYSDSGSFDPSTMPDNMRAWLQGYADEIKWMDDHNIQPVQQASARRESATVKRTVSPMISTLWNQDTPYNNLVPEYKPGELSATGCVATAMAQIMKYHEWPKDETPVIPHYGLQTTDLSSVTFDWDNMIEDYSDGYSDTQANAVATLMLYCGVSVEMSYGASSGASTKNVAVALRKYYNYDEFTTRYIDRKDYSYAEWVEQIYEEIAAERPVCYGGQSSGGGHEFVVDGFDTDDYFHINWGWGGQSNGYFRLALLDPAEQGIGGSSTDDGFHYGQEAVIGIQPGNGTYVESPVVTMTSDGIKIQNGITTLTRSGNVNFQTFYVSASFWNLAEDNQAHSFNYGFALYKEGTLVMMLNQKSTDNLSYRSGWALGNPYVGIAIGQDLEDGTYMIVPVSKEKGSTTWYKNFGWNEAHITAVIDGDNLYLTAPISKDVNLTVNSVTFSTGSCTLGTEVTATVNITNSGSDDYDGDIDLYVGGIGILGGDMFKIPSGTTRNCTIKFVPKYTGTYYVYVMDGSHYLSNNYYVLTVSGGSITDNVDLDTSVAVDNLEGNLLYGRKLNAVLTITNNSTSTYWGTFEWAIFMPTSDNIYNASEIILPAGSSKQMNIRLSDLEYGEDYTIATIYVKNSSWSGWKTEKQFTASPVVTVYDVNGTAQQIGLPASYTVPENVTAIDASYANTTLTPNSNPNTLYFLGYGDDTANLTDKNVIIDGVADNIALTDGYNFKCPLDFTAHNISYSRVFTTGANLTGGWTTITVPFDVQTVKADGETIDWFHKATDVDKDFWMKRFASDEPTMVYFDYADVMEAGKPYIIAIPGDAWGSQYDLTGKTISFEATDVEVSGASRPNVNGSSYNFHGTTSKAAHSNIYALNNNGDRFELTTASKQIDAFRGFFEPISYGAVAPALIIRHGDGSTTGLNDLRGVTTRDASDNTLYRLDGTKVRSLRPTEDGSVTSGLPKGVYIMNGKKIIK